MNDTIAEKRARMACRVYLKLFDAPEHRAVIRVEDALGPRDTEADRPLALAVVQDMLTNEHVHDLEFMEEEAGIVTASLAIELCEHMQAFVVADRTRAEVLRSRLAELDRGEDVEGTIFRKAQAEIRTGLRFVM